jgi:hypothetical protein
VRLTPAQVFAALVSASGLTAFIAFFHQDLLRIHQGICRALLAWVGIPILGTQDVELYPVLSTVAVDLLDVRRLDQHPFLFLSLFCGVVLILLALHKRFPLVRGLIVFVIALVCFGAGDILLQPDKQLAAMEFATAWLRGEVLVWLLLPWFAAAMMIAVHPMTHLGVSLSVLTVAACFVWSAIRLAFGLAVMHIGGALFVPLFWFGLGFLADVVLLTVAYSIAVFLVAERLPGRRP